MENKDRILAHGTTSGHAHIVTGECEIIRDGDQVRIKAIKGCAIKHLREAEFLATGAEVWTKGHKEIAIPDGEEYIFIQQTEYNPYLDAIQAVND